jgi:hypothetical protein
MADFQALATKLISKNGRPVSLVSSTGGAPVAVGKPWLGQAASEVLTPTKAFFMDAQAHDQLSRITAVSRLVLATVEQNKTVALISGDVAVTPTTAMMLQDGTRRWRIETVGKLEQGATVAVYVLKLGN